MKLLFIIIIFISGLLSQDMGYKMYENGDIDSALDYYKKLANLNDEDLSSQDLLYNIGTIYAQMDSTEQASSVFEKVYNDSAEFSSDLDYNYGNTLYRSQKLEKSLKAFRESILKNPNDLNARKNYEFVRNEIEKNKNIQKKKDQSEDSDKEENDKDQNKDNKKDKKDNSEKDQPNNQEDKNDSNNNDNGSTDNQNSKLPNQENQQNREIQSNQSAENILNAIKENEKVNKKRKQTNYSNESGKDW
tara:strand:- start:6695 stop:7432 length:738 start_codon:yes stop_codon:yes gene_type:complete